MPPRRNAAARSSMRTRPWRTRVCSVEEGRSLRRNSASGNSPPQAASSASIACCFAVRVGRRVSGMRTAKRSVRRASRSTAEVSRAIHFFLTRPASTGSVAAVAVRSVETLTGSPAASRSRTRRSRSWSSFESFPRRLDLVRLRDLAFADRGVRRIAVDAAGQHVAAQVGDAVVNGAAHLGHQRQHAAQHLAQRREIVLRNPFGQCEQVLAEQRLFVKNCFDGTRFKILQEPWRTAR